jgi:hypothetical protein
MFAAEIFDFIFCCLVARHRFFLNLIFLFATGPQPDPVSFVSLVSGIRAAAHELTIPKPRSHFCRLIYLARGADLVFLTGRFRVVFEELSSCCAVSVPHCPASVSLLVEAKRIIVLVSAACLRICSQRSTLWISCFGFLAVSSIFVIFISRVGSLIPILLHAARTSILPA